MSLTCCSYDPQFLSGHFKDLLFAFGMKAVVLQCVKVWIAFYYPAWDLL